ncbi:hypothetical protein F4806DRAFT_497841 [Annulohypoxylon nitens]|nr:hypothetical protein F4806DRAFT_497841 [Annulohypoxylon nitens]
MVKENDVIAIIIIVLFIVLALIAFGIYRLVHMARTQGTISEESGSGTIQGDTGPVRWPDIHNSAIGRTQTAWSGLALPG